VRPHGAFPSDSPARPPSSPLETATDASYTDSMYCDHRVAVVIPARNEEELILATLRGVPGIVDRIYVIDDGSSDQTVVAAESAEDPRVTVICHEKNLGVGAAIISGYRRAFAEGADIAVVVGGDNQMDLAEIANFLDPIVDGDADYAKGNRFLEPGSVLQDMPRVRLFANALISGMTKIASGYHKVYDVVDGYTALSRRGYESLDWNAAWKGYGYPMDFLIRLNTAGVRVVDVPRRAIYTPGVRQSQIKGFSYACRVFPLLVRGFFRRLLHKYVLRDFHPLVFFYLMGLALVPAGLGFGLFLIFQQAAGIGVSGPRAILCALMLLAGIQGFLFAISFEIQLEASSTPRARRNPASPDSRSNR
jgi:glycosyltransferase involved in cell wall biosynthesis